MTTTANLDRYREDNRFRRFVAKYKALVAVIAFLALNTLVAFVFGTLGYPQLAGMILSWNFLVSGVLFVFAVIPLYAIRFLPSYHKF